MGVLSEVQFEGMAVLGGVVAISTTVLEHIGMGLHVGVEHRFVHTAITAFRALEWFGSLVIPQMIFQVVFVLGNERALGAGQHLLRFDVTSGMFPEAEFGHCYEVTLFAFEFLNFAVRVDFGLPDSVFVFAAVVRLSTF